jgi:hypothetical protein
MGEEDNASPLNSGSGMGMSVHYTMAVLGNGVPWWVRGHCHVERGSWNDVL